MRLIHSKVIHLYSYNPAKSFLTLRSIRHGPWICGWWDGVEVKVEMGVFLAIFFPYNWKILVETPSECLACWDFGEGKGKSYLGTSMLKLRCFYSALPCLQQAGQFWLFHQVWLGNRSQWPDPAYAVELSWSVKSGLRLACGNSALDKPQRVPQLL